MHPLAEGEREGKRKENRRKKKEKEAIWDHVMVSNDVNGEIS